MRYSIACLGAFAITTLAVPLETRQQNEVQVNTQTPPPVKEVKITLSNKREDPGDGSFKFAETIVKADGKKVEAIDNNNNGGEGFKYINIEVQGLPEGQENGDLRCQAIGKDEDSLAGKRGENQDVNFSDAGNGAWEFLLGDVDVEAFICDPAFKKITAEELEAGKLTDVVLRAKWGGRRAVVAKGFNGLEKQTAKIPRRIAESEFATVEVKTGKFFTEGVGQELRCGLIGEGGQPIVAQRAENIDTTFSDKANGQWAFLDEEIEEEVGDGAQQTQRVRRQAVSQAINGEGQLPAPEWDNVPEIERPEDENQMNILGEPVEDETVTAKVFAIVCDPAFVAQIQSGSTEDDGTVDETVDETANEDANVIEAFNLVEEEGEVPTTTLTAAVQIQTAA